jgi:hypothetical protein
MGSAVVRKLKTLIPGMVGDYPSAAKIYRERGGTPILDETGAVRMRYDDLPDMHQLETGEETKAVDLDAIIQKYESEDPDDATYIIQGVPGPDGNKRDLVLQGVYEEGSMQEMSRMGGTPTVHFYEAQSGQLVNWLPKFVDTEALDGDIHKQMRQADEGEFDRYDVPDGIKNAPEMGIRPYLIDNKDERLTAWMDHLKKKFEKYSGSEGFWEEHFQVAMVLAVGFSIAMIYYAVLPNLGELLPVAKQIMGDLNTIAPNMEQLAGSMTEGGSQGGQGAPPGN